MEDLEKTPGAESFFQELAKEPGLREALDSGAEPGDMRRFHSLVVRYEDDAAFLHAVKNPSPVTETAPCGDPEAAAAKTPILASKDEPSSPFEAPPGCAADASPVGAEDLFLNPAGSSSLQ